MAIHRFTLDNGLQVVFDYYPNTPVAAVNMLYKVGSRDEQEDKTGFAHLFEHLMFEGSKNIKHFDKEVERVGGTNNAFTNNDFTNYYIILPKENIETALWLESDRMLELDFSEEKLGIQKNVVIEEFKENYINKPYGDLFKYVFALSYQKHPYKWLTIGKCLSHIEKATLEDVKNFFFGFYAPNNAILSISGDYDLNYVKDIVNKWFSDIPKRKLLKHTLPQEPEQTTRREMNVFRDVPAEYIVMAFQGFDRLSPEYYVADLITDILSYGLSSRLERKLVKEKRLFNDIDAYLTDRLDKGLVIVLGSPTGKISLDEAEQVIWEELEILKNELVSDEELIKFKNLNEINFHYLNMSVSSRAMNFAYYEMLGDANLFFSELKKYNNISKQQIKTVAQSVFKKQNVSVLFYRQKQKYSPKQRELLRERNFLREEDLNC